MSPFLSFPSFHDFFIYQCSTNNIDNLIDHLQRVFNLDISIIEYAFILACVNGHINVIKQLFQWFPYIDLNVSNYAPFRLASRFYKLDIIKQLLIWNPNYINVIDFNDLSIFVKIFIHDLGYNIFIE